MTALTASKQWRCSCCCGLCLLGLRVFWVDWEYRQTLTLDPADRHIEGCRVRHVQASIIRNQPLPTTTHDRHLTVLTPSELSRKSPAPSEDIRNCRPPPLPPPPAPSTRFSSYAICSPQITLQLKTNNNKYGTASTPREIGKREKNQVFSPASEILRQQQPDAQIWVLCLQNIDVSVGFYCRVSLWWICGLAGNVVLAIVFSLTFRRCTSSENTRIHCSLYCEFTRNLLYHVSSELLWGNAG